MRNVLKQSFRKNDKLLLVRLHVLVTPIDQNSKSSKLREYLAKA